MKKGFVIILFFVSIAMILNVSSIFEEGIPNFDIEKQYTSNDYIKGWINISLENEIADSLFTDSFNNEISLFDLLKLNNADYECFPSDCKSDYSSANPESQKVFSLNQGESKIIGFNITGNQFETISDFSINISSTAGESTVSQLFVDVLNDGAFEWKSDEPSGNFYNEDYGCYDSPDETVLIYNQKYCEKINIPIAPNVEIGANVISETGESAVFILSLDGEGVGGYCEVTVSSTGRIACVLNIKIDKKQDFEVCIKTKTSSDNNKYKINSETNNPCGFANIPINERDFEIFAKPGKYVAMSEFALNNEELENKGTFIDLRSYIGGYIERYNDSCSNGCIIPIKFFANKLQTITVSNAKILYTISGTPIEKNDIYDLTKLPAKISSGFQKIFLDNAGFEVLGDFDEDISYSLDLNGNEIISEEITISEILKIISVTPRVAIAAYPFSFKVNIENPDPLTSITNYLWKFGDGSTRSTSENRVTHTYNSVGTYNLEVTITDSNSLNVSKSFTISIKTPKTAINSVLRSKLNNLNSVNSQINGLNIFYKNTLREYLGLEDLEEELSSLQKRNSTARTDEDYIKIMDDLIKLNIPKSVFESKKADLISFSFDEKNINLETLKEIGKDDYNESEKELYIRSIFTWNLNNIDAKITFKEFSVEYEYFTGKILNVFKLKINENQTREDFYFVIENIENLEFKENYGQREMPGYTYIKLGKEEALIEFSTTEDFSFENLPVFISPELRKLSITRIKISGLEEKLLGLSMLILIVLFVAFIGFITYIILQEWYKRKYENYLFKNKNSLYNLILYIENTKKRGIKNEEISKQLKKSGWNSEQITYIMRKYAGERTGMFEIPISKILDLFKKKQNTKKMGLQKNRRKN